MRGRPRLFEVLEVVRKVNAARQRQAPQHRFSGKSHDDVCVRQDASVALDVITATPRMAQYIAYSTRIYEVYLKYIAPEDIHVYSIDEVFLDATAYLGAYRQTARELAATIVRDVVRTTGITATAGIGSNLYLAKVAMDVMAKKCAADADGVRIAVLDELSYRRELWAHQPLTDFWRVGTGYAKKLARYGLHTMGDIARFSLRYEDTLFRLFGVNAELLIDHAWGVEPCSMADIKAYKPASKSVGTGQVLHSPYTSDKARLVVREMADALSLDLVEKALVCRQLVLTVGYDCLHAEDGGYTGEVTVDAYGRRIPRHAHGTGNLADYTASTHALTAAALAVYDRIINVNLLVRRINLVACHVLPERDAPTAQPQQLSLFTMGDADAQDAAQARSREKKQQEVLLQLRKTYGKNAILKGLHFQEGATTRERNLQIGGHKA